MSDDIERDNSATQLPGLRRIFLKKTVLAAATSAATALLPASGRSEMHEDRGWTKRCRDTKAPMEDVKGKVAFITGGSSGIGLGIARAFADAGMRVVITYRTNRHHEQARDYLKEAGDRVHSIKVDVTDRPGMEAAAKETVARFGKVHVLVNNAGIYAPAVLTAVSERDWDRIMDVNVKGVLNGVQTFLPLIQSHGEGGQILATSSILGLFVYLPHEAVYAASKFAVVGLMESLRMEMMGTNIGVSVLCPGWTQGRSGWGIDRNSISEKEAAEFDRLDRARVEAGLAIDDRTYGELVLRGMRNNDLYILTHPEWEQMIQYRHAALMAAVPRDLHPTEKLLAESSKLTQGSIYVAERNRCADR